MQQQIKDQVVAICNRNSIFPLMCGLLTIPNSHLAMMHTGFSTCLQCTHMVLINEADKERGAAHMMGHTESRELHCVG